MHFAETKYHPPCSDPIQDLAMKGQIESSRGSNAKKAPSRACLRLSNRVLALVGATSYVIFHKSRRWDK